MSTTVAEQRPRERKILEFYLITADELASLQQRELPQDGSSNNTSATPLNLPSSAAAGTVDSTQDVWTPLLQNLKSEDIQYQSWHQPFLLNDMPTKKRCSYIINALTMESEPVPLAPADAFEVVRVARALVDAGIPETSIKKFFY